MSWFVKLASYLPNPNRPRDPLGIPPPPALAGEATLASHCADLRAMLRLHLLYKDHVEGVLRSPDFQPTLPRLMAARETPLTQREYRRMASFLRGEAARAAADSTALQDALSERCGDASRDFESFAPAP